MSNKYWARRGVGDNGGRLFLNILILMVFWPGVAWGADKSPEAAGEPDPVVKVSVGQSQVVKTPWPVKRVAITDPKIATVQVLTPRQVLVQGTEMGSTDLVLWKDDETFVRKHIEVGADLAVLRNQLTTMFPGTTLRLSQSQGVVIVDGKLRRSEQAHALSQFFKARGITRVDTSSVAGVQQVLIHVRIAEVSRTAIRELGVNIFGNWSDFQGASLIGSDAGGSINPLTGGTGAGLAAAVAPGVTVFGAIPGWDLLFFLRALEENQYLRVLAEPRLVALSGEKASFLAGGEFPIPVVQGTSVGVGSSISIEYREFGVSLNFQPTVLGDGEIRLFIAPEVSELSELGAVTIQGFRVPAIVTRRAETTLQLKSGQTFAMAGLMRRFTQGRSTKLPWLGDIPILGALASSKRHTTGETELVIMVTPTLVEPMSKTPPLPGVLGTNPDDWEFYALGKVEGKTRPMPRVASEELQWMQSIGLHSLRGPGAWARHGQSTPHSSVEIQPVGN